MRKQIPERKNLLLGGDAIQARQKRITDEDARIRVELEQRKNEFPELKAPGLLGQDKPVFSCLFKLIEEGDYLILDINPNESTSKRIRPEFTSENAQMRFFHVDCPGCDSKMKRLDMALFTKTHRITIVDISDIPRLSEELEWPTYLTRKHRNRPNCCECTCPLKEYVLTCPDVQLFRISLPHPYFYLFDMHK
jgi:hypothetical protein